MDRGAIEPAEILDGAMALDEEVRRATSIEVDPATIAAVEQRLDVARAGGRAVLRSAR